MIEERLKEEAAAAEAAAAEAAGTVATGKENESVNEDIEMGENKKKKRKAASRLDDFIMWQPEFVALLNVFAEYPHNNTLKIRACQVRTVFEDDNEFQAAKHPM